MLYYHWKLPYQAAFKRNNRYESPFPSRKKTSTPTPLKQTDVSTSSSPIIRAIEHIFKISPLSCFKQQEILLTLYYITIHLTAPLQMEYSEIQPPWETLPPPHPHYIDSVRPQRKEVKHYFQEEGRVWFHCWAEVKYKKRKTEGKHVLSPGIPHHLQAWAVLLSPFQYVPLIPNPLFCFL